VDCEHEHAILHLRSDVRDLEMYSLGHQGERDNADQGTNLGMWRDLQPPKELSKFSLTFCSLALFGGGLRKWGLCSPSNCYLSRVSIRLSRERHLEFIVLNTRQLEHGNHSVGIDVELNISPN
jgi:hypothetical protein